MKFHQGSVNNFLKLDKSDNYGLNVVNKFNLYANNTSDIYDILEKLLSLINDYIVQLVSSERDDSFDFKAELESLIKVAKKASSAFARFLPYMDSGTYIPEVIYERYREMLPEYYKILKLLNSLVVTGFDYESASDDDIEDFKSLLIRVSNECSSMQHLLVRLSHLYNNAIRERLLWARDELTSCLSLSSEVHYKNIMDREHKENSKSIDNKDRKYSSSSYLGADHPESDRDEGFVNGVQVYSNEEANNLIRQNRVSRDVISSILLSSASLYGASALGLNLLKYSLPSPLVFIIESIVSFWSVSLSNGIALGRDSVSRTLKICLSTVLPAFAIGVGSLSIVPTATTYALSLTGHATVLATYSIRKVFAVGIPLLASAGSVLITAVAEVVSGSLTDLFVGFNETLNIVGDFLFGYFR